MKKTKPRFILPLLLAGLNLLDMSVSSAHAQNILYNLTGCSAGPNDFDLGVLQGYCASQKNWTVHSYSSLPCHSPQQDSSLPKAATAAAPVRASAAIASSAIIDDLVKNTHALKSGDQLLFSLLAHGSSTCSAIAVGNQTGNSDLGAGNPGGPSCEHSFALRLPGSATTVQVETEDLIPALQALQARGVRVAVELKSCFGGAAVRPFAKAGLCAQAYTTGDSLMSTCGGSITSDSEFTGSADLALLQACAGLSPKRLQDFAEMAGFAPGTKTCLFTQDRKTYPDHPGLIEALNGLSVSDFDKGPALSSYATAIRKYDRTTNMPIGTDGPFWIFEHLGFLGTSPSLIIYGRSLLPAQANLNCLPEVSHYFDRLTDQIQKIVTATLRPDCDLKNEVMDFVKSHRQPLERYYSLFKGASEAKRKLDQIIAAVPIDAQNIIHAKAKALLPAVQGSAALLSREEAVFMAISSASSLPDGSVCPKSCADENAGCKSYCATSIKNCIEGCQDPGSPLCQRCEKMTLASCEQTCVAPDALGCHERCVTGIQSQIEPALRPVIEKNPNFLKSFDEGVRAVAAKAGELREHHRTRLAPVERELYVAIKKSEAYKKCVAADPMLDQARRNCEAFRLPGR